MDSEVQETFITNSTNLIRSYTIKIVELHKKMFGENQEKNKEVFNWLTSCLEEYLEDLLGSCEMKLDNLLKEAEDKCLEIHSLQEELGVKEELAVDDSDPLVTTYDKLKNIHDNLLSLKASRMARWEALLEQDKKLCEALDEAVYPPISGTASDQDIQALNEHVEKLAEEKVRRSETFHNLRESILSLMNIVEYDQSLAIQNYSLDADGDLINLKLEHLERMKKFEEALKKQYEKCSEDVECMKINLERLWNRIQIDDEHKTKFLNSLKGIGQTSQNMLKMELERCEELKKTLLGPIIENIRKEIDEIWEKLTYTEEQKKCFSCYYNDTYSDNILTLHEIELLKLQTLYEDNKHIYELAEKRETLRQRMRQLREAALDKNRLFKNRGGQLLKEEKERKILEVSVPKTDQMLRKYLIQFQEKSCTPFLWHGRNLLEEISKDSDCDKALNEPTKVTKKIENCCSNQMDPGTNIAISGPKRKILQVPSSENIPQKYGRVSPFKTHNVNSQNTGLKHAADGLVYSSTETLGDYRNFRGQINAACGSENQQPNTPRMLNSPMIVSHSSVNSRRPPKARKRLN